jgi:hypothetical protein
MKETMGDWSRHQQIAVSLAENLVKDHSETSSLGPQNKSPPHQLVQAGEFCFGCARYVRSSSSPPRFRRRIKRCFADPQTRAIDDGQFP